MGYTRDLKSMQSLGYRQMAVHLTGAISIDEAACQIKKQTRHYAKRQITWFVVMASLDLSMQTISTGFPVT